MMVHFELREGLEDETPKAAQGGLGGGLVKASVWSRSSHEGKMR